MVSCYIYNCSNEVLYMCLCSVSIQFICSKHLETHLQIPFQHEISSLEAKTAKSSYDYIDRTLKDSKEHLNKLKKYFEESKIKLESAIRNIDSALIIMDERCEEIQFLLSILEDENIDPNSYANKNLQTYKRISEEKLSKILKKIIVPESEPLNLPNFSLASGNEFFSTIENIIRPVIKAILPNQFEISAPSEFQTDINPTAHKYYNGTMNYTQEVTIKLYEILDTTNRQLENHLRLLSFNPAFLSVMHSFKKLNKLQIVTEPWTHTLWNELITRRHEDAFFDQNRLLEIYEQLLIAFQNENEQLFMTPNLIHVTNTGEWKIWYPPIISKGIKKYPYSSPEACRKKGFDYKLSNLFSLGLVILELATLKDTSKMYKKKNEKALEDLVMMITDGNLRKALIRVVMQKPNLRMNYTQAIKIIEGSRV